MSTGVPVGGLEALSKLQTIEIGTPNLLHHHILPIIIPITSLYVKEITFHFIVTTWKATESQFIERDQKAGRMMLSGVDDALVSAQFPCLRKVKVLCAWSWCGANVHSFIQEAFPQCHEHGLLSIG
jgi:hypothetical protein